MVEWEMKDFSGEDQNFVVERSSDKEEFEEIGEAERVINVGNLNHFEYYDKKPKKGRSFYRVKLIDTTGTFVVSNTVEILLDDGIAGVLIYPNPFKNHLFLEILDDTQEAVRVDIISTNGVVLKSFDVGQETFREEIDLSFLPKGLYILVVNISGEPPKTLRVVKT